MWQHLYQSEPEVQQPDVLVEIEAGEPDERRLIRDTQEREGSLIARLAQAWKAGVEVARRRSARGARPAAWGQEQVARGARA